MKIQILEGTPEELKAYMDLEARPSESAVTTTDTSFLEDYEGGIMSKEVAFRCLSRIKLPATMLGIVTMLHAKHPTPVSGADLAKKLGLTMNQLTGVFGAFGRRCANTPGYEKHDHFFSFTGKSGDWSYKLTDESLAAVGEYLKRANKRTSH